MSDKEYKSLYHPRYLSLNDAGNQVDIMTTEAIRDIFKFWMDEGYSPREISQVMQSSINMEELYQVLNIGSEEHKKDVKRMEKNKNDHAKKGDSQSPH